MLTLIVLTLLAVGSAALGALWQRSRMTHEANRYSARALAARIAVSRALPLMTEAMPDDADSLMTDDQRSALVTAIERLRALQWGTGRYYRHDRRGTYYEVLAENLYLQTSGLPPVRDGDLMTLYVGVRDGRLSCRHPVEFHDGRFTRVTRDEAYDAGDEPVIGTMRQERGDRELLRRIDRAGS